MPRTVPLDCEPPLPNPAKLKFILQIFSAILSVGMCFLISQQDVCLELRSKNGLKETKTTIHVDF